uniref:Uncharacterized protein n=1 Tax=Rhizophora mucronata TaxID=61149 RepID=A0A2P2P6B8_RHIMU
MHRPFQFVRCYNVFLLSSRMKRWLYV